MRRRAFLTLAAGAAVGRPLSAWAEQNGGTPTIGVIMGVAQSDSDSQARIAAFRQRFSELDWRDGENIHIEYRWAAGSLDLIERYAGEMVALKPAVILANGTPVVAALQKMTATIPIVCAMVNDPVGLGFVKSLSRPGGNITGFTFIDPDLIGKWMELLKSSAPSASRAALFNPETAPFYRDFLSEIAVAHSAGPLDLMAMPVVSPDEMERAVGVFAQQPGGSLLVGPDPFNIVHIARIAQIAATLRLPGISVYRPFAVAGGLMSYGPDTADIFRSTANYVDRILKGANPAELPVQQPTKFEFIVNLKVAKALAIDFPPTMLALADEVIE